MNAATWTAIVGPITTLLAGGGGYFLAGRNDEARDRRAADREAVARRAALAERLEEQRHTFQRDLLLELQDELQHLIRATAKVLLQDQKTLKDKGSMYQLPAGLSDEAYQIGITVGKLKTRVLDATLRTAISEFHSSCTEAELKPSELLTAGQATETVSGWIAAKLRDLGVEYLALVELLGEQLRGELDRRYLVDGIPAGDPLQSGQLT